MEMNMSTGTRLVLIVVVLALMMSACGGNSASSAAKPSVSTASTATVVPRLKLMPVFSHAGKFRNPVALLQSPDNNDDFYLVEKSGRILRINETNKQEPVVVLNIRERVNSGSNESGLLGMAFDPRYQQTRQIILSYNRAGSPLVSYISRFYSSDNGQSFDIDSEEVILTVDQPYGNHNGGNVAFGHDGMLYIGLGDGGSGGDPNGHGQNTKTLLGAMLRLDINSKKPYAIPADNPFARTGEGRPEIYAWGLRNPWRWSFDRKTGKLWAADVGQNHWEEVDIIDVGGNYGWNIREGNHDYNPDVNVKGVLVAPVAEYSHDAGCSITGGYVYRGQAIPELQGSYLYGDFCEGTIWGLPETGKGVYNPVVLLDSNLGIASFAEDNAGELYVLHYGGTIFKIVKSS